MAIYNELTGKTYQFQGGSKEKIWLRVRTSTLAKLFNVNKRTILRWIRLGLINPKDMLDIVNKYNNRHLLDRRMRLPRGEKDNDIKEIE